jgi:hypothetical protein
VAAGGLGVSERWDLAAIKDGAGVCVMFAVPPTIIARLLVDDQDATSGWAPLLLVLSLGGFLVGGGVAAWRQRRGTPLSHGVLTAAAVFAVVQSVFVLIRVIIGGEIPIGRILVSFSLATAAGLAGGLLGSLLQQRGVTSQRGDP